MKNLPPIPQEEGVDRNWSPETWRAGLDEAVRRMHCGHFSNWQSFHAIHGFVTAASDAIIAHATTLLDAGIVKPVVSEAAAVLEHACIARTVNFTRPLWECPDAIAVIQSALDKARAGQ